MTAAPLYIHGLRAENWMRLSLVELRFTGAGLELVTGKNGEGKSSLLRAIWAALGGKAAIPDQPVRAGQERAEVSLDLGDKIVKLRVKPDRSTTLVVEGKEGVVHRNPQRMLDELVGKLSFDPLLFAGMDQKKQAETLRALVGLDTSKLDAERAEVYARRTDVGRLAKAAEGALAAMPAPAAPTAIGQEIVLADLLEENRRACAQAAENSRVRDARSRAAAGVEQARAAVAKLEEQLAAARKALASREDDLAGLDADVSMLAEPDLDGIMKRINAAEGHNAAVRERRILAERATIAAAARDAKSNELRALNATVAGATRRIEEIDTDKAARLAAAKFPCPGLGVDGDVVTFQGIPLAQCSSAEQIRICLSIAAALNPTLRLLIVRQGNDLDNDRLRQVAEWAVEHSYQVILERVAGDQPAGIVIEAGRVAADLRATEGAA